MGSGGDGPDFSRWTEACPLPDKTALSVADAFFQHIVCTFGSGSGCGSPMGLGGDGPVGHHCERQSVRFGYGGLFLQMDGSVSIARQDSLVSGGCLLSTYCVSIRNAYVIHSDQGREFENKVMQELCLLCGSHKTRTTPYHPENDGLV